MLLRRITKHVTDQNWFAVFLDFLIVVVGILIAFQITNWSEVRAQAEAEEKILKRLVVEMTILEQELKLDTKDYTLFRAGTASLIEMLRSGIKPQEDTEFRQALWAAGSFSDVPSISGTYLELLSNGGLAKLSNPELRNALISYGDYSERYERISINARADIIDPNSNYMRAVKWSTDTKDWGSYESSIVSYDWELLLDSEAELQVWLTHHHASLRNVSNMLKDVQKILKLLDEEAL